MDQRDYEIWLSNITGIGIRKIELLLKEFASVKQIYDATQQDFKRIKGLSVKDISNIFESKNNGYLNQLKEELRGLGMMCIPYTSTEFPACCKEIYDPPKQLFVVGSLPEEQVCVGIVGARHCSHYGRECARYFAHELALAGIGVVSGMARGIDGWAHQGALEGRGSTYAVLGNSAEIVYPKEHEKLYQSICRHGGIISEYPPGTTARAGFFPMRNRIISAFSEGILVVEAMEKSGSLITAQEALEQGKDVFVIPGRIEDSLSEGCNNLIKQGAYLVTKPEEIMQHYGIKKKENFVNMKFFLERKEKMVYASLRLEPKHVRELVKELDMDMIEIMKCIHTLSKQGFIQEIGNHYYIKKQYSE